MTEVDVEPGPPGRDDADRPGTAARRAALLRVLRRWWPVAAVAVVAVVGWQVLDDARERSAAERHRQTPGVIGTTVGPDLAATPWGGGSGTILLRDGAQVADGRVLGLESGSSVHATLYDSVSGTSLWRTRLVAADPEVGPVVDPAGGACTGDGDAEPETLWCAVPVLDLVSDDATVVTTTLVGLDAGSGAVVAEHTLDAGVSGGVVGELLVTAALTPAGAAVTATDALSGAGRWTATVPDVVARESLEPLRVDRVGDLVVVADAGRSWALDPADGHLVAEAQDLRPARSGGLAAVDGSSSTRLVGTSGEAGPTLGGTPMTIAPDDGSAPDVEVVFRADGSLRGQVRAVDARTGDVLWEAPGPVESFAPLVLLDGVLYGDDGSEVWARDARTGDEVWRTATARGTSTLVTDGVALLRTERAGSGGAGAPVLAAYALDDGSRRWAVPLPGGVREIWAQEGTTGGPLLGRTETGEIVTLG